MKLYFGQAPAVDCDITPSALLALYRMVTDGKIGVRLKCKIALYDASLDLRHLNVPKTFDGADPLLTEQNLNL